jgi:hypothetical protein
VRALCASARRIYLVKGVSEPQLVIRTVRHAVERHASSPISWRRGSASTTSRMHDIVLTGLANRSAFLDHLRRQLGYASRHGKRLAVTVPRPRPLQEHQRHARASGRRRPAEGGRRPARGSLRQTDWSRGSAATSS